MQKKKTFPMIFDGAFGTYYFSITGDECPCELANLSAPELVRGIHSEYVQAGVDAIKTNTFGANARLCPDEKQLRAVLAGGWELAHEAVRNTNVQVFADIGGLAGETAADDYLTVAEHFCALGAKHFVFETLGEFEPLLPALRRIGVLCPDAKVIVSFAVSQDGYTRRGLYYQTMLRQAAETPEVSVVGLNCASGPSRMLSLMRALPPLSKPLCAMPNAGYPSALNGRMVFEDNADYFAGRLADLYRAGVDIVGGCCGSTPRHIRLAAEAVRLARRPERITWEAAPAPARLDENALPPRARKLIAVELQPPLDADCSFVVSAAAALHGRGTDIITLSDAPLSRARADSVMTAAKLRRETGVEVMPHLACRDRNRIALKASLLGASFEGIRRVLVITGDPPLGGEDGVFRFNSYELIRYIAQLNQDVLAAAPFQISAAINVNAVNFDAELERASTKLERGATMLLSQPIFTMAAEENFRRAAQTLACPLLAGILPVAGYKNAVFLQNEVSGITLPSELLEQLRVASPEQVTAISTAHSAGVAERLFDVAAGYYIMTPLRKIDIVQGLIHAIRDKEENTE